ncbi:hypothetical protein J6590_070303 [Homalodisca vitripennis]|nr:hypothetical protein J6590_070303 [Homalodisca vitripennis]
MQASNCKEAIAEYLFEATEYSQSSKWNEKGGGRQNLHAEILQSHSSILFRLRVPSIWVCRTQCS